MLPAIPDKLFRLHIHLDDGRLWMPTMDQFTATLNPRPYKPQPPKLTPILPRFYWRQEEDPEMWPIYGWGHKQDILDSMGMGLLGGKIK